MDNPQNMGADCIADCAGAYYEYGGPILVADFGTATTFNYVTADASVISGLITTGIRTAAAALWEGTAQLPEVEITRPKSILAKSTKPAMQAGLYYNFLGGIERTIAQFHKEIDEDFRVVATGGFEPRVRRRHEHDRHLRSGPDFQGHAAHLRPKRPLIQEPATRTGDHSPAI